MSSYYGTPQNPPYSHGQHSSGPPPPPWQAPVQPPRPPQWQSQPPPAGQYPYTPVPPQPYSTNSSGANGYGVPTKYPAAPPMNFPGNTAHGISPVPQYGNTAGWGVRYNQTQPQQPPYEPPAPILPPRPSSATPGRTESPYSQEPPPPPPPPRPVEYGAVNSPNQYTPSQWPHEHYSQRPPSHHYEPSAPPAWPSDENTRPSPGNNQSQASTWQSWKHPGQGEAPLVSPEDSTPQPWSRHPSTLSHQQSAISLVGPPSAPPVSQQQISNTPQDVSGPTSAFMSGPSDWEHFTPTDYMEPDPQEIYTSPIQPNWRQDAIPPAVTSATPRQEIYTSPIQPQWGHDNGNFSSVPALPSQPVVAPTNLPLKDFDSRVSTPILTETSPGRPELNHLSSQGSVSSMGTVDAINPPDNIDSVIQAWNQPSQEARGNLNTVTTPVQTHNQLTTPKGMDSSPQRTNLSSTPSPLRYPQSKRSKIEEKSDLYQDLDAEYHSSLARFVNMLRKESAASTDEEKYATFQTFMQRELRVRQILYGVEAAPNMQSPADHSRTKTNVSTDGYANGSIKGATKEPSITRTISLELQRKAVSLPKTTSPIVQAANTTTAGSASQLGDLSPQPQQQLVEAGTTSKDLANVTQSRPTLETENSTHQLVTQESPKLEQHTQMATLPQVDGPATGRTASVEDNYKRDVQKSGQQATSELSTRDLATRLGNDSVEAVTNTLPKVELSHREVVSEVSEEGEYSPGGRPRIPKVKPSSITALYTSIGRNALSTDQPLHNVPAAPASPSDNAPMVIEDYVMQSPSANAPMLVGTETVFQQNNGVGGTTPIPFEPARPAYTPFKYDASQRSTPPPPIQAAEQPADQAYSALRVQASENGRLLGPEALPMRPATAPLRPETTVRTGQQESFLGLIRSHSKAHRSDRPATAMALSRQIVPLADPASLAISSLQMTLPTALPVSGSVDAKLTQLQREADKSVDDFTFIRDTVLSWDKHNRVVRARLEKARDERQELSGRHLDELFNANEISYAELNRAEADFRVAEATSKYEEDQQELQSFSETVFTTVTTRLHAELALLQPLYDTALKLLDNESDAVSREVAGAAGRVQMFAAMDISLHIFRKLEIRHQKLAEARFERERRRKKLELTVLYTNGDTAGVKRLEQDFNRAENLQVLKESQDRDLRANKMMDIFDRSAVRGLGDNQTLIDDLLAKTKKVKEVLTVQGQSSSTSLSGDTSTVNALNLTNQIIDTVWANSRSILAISNSADKLLNEADYAVSVADARVANASKAMFLKLEQDKAKEEARLAEEMAVRLDGMSKAPTEATALIQDILVRVSEEPSRQNRMTRALEEAKRRNAVKEGAPG